MTTTAQPLTIPPAGLRAELANGVVVSAMYVNGAGYKVQVRIDGEHRPELGGLYTFDTAALPVFNQLVADLTPAGAALALAA